MNLIKFFVQRFKTDPINQGAVSVLMVALLSTLLVLGSLFANFVPNAYAQPQINLLDPDIVAACGDAGEFYYSPNVDFVDAGNFDYAEWWVDELTPQTANVSNSDGNRLYFQVGPIDCLEYDDGLTHTFNFIVYSFEGTESISRNFSIGGGARTVSVYVQPSNGDILLDDPGDDITGDVSIDAGSITGIGFQIDSGGFSGVNADDGTFDSNFEYFSVYDVVSYYGLSNGFYTLEFEIVDEANTYYYETYNLEVNVPAQAPTITVDQNVAGVITLNADPMNVTGDSAVSGSTISSMTYTVTGQVTDQAVTADDGTFDGSSEAFTIDIDALNLTDGTYELSIRSTAANSQFTVETYSLVVDNPAPPDIEDPTCGTTWYNQTSPSYTDEWTYSDIVCTDNIGVASASWRIYHYVDGQLVTDNIDAPLVGSYGDTEVTLEFTAAIPAGPNHDGALDVELTVSDAQGNSVTYKDPLVVDYADQTEPTLSLQLVKPERLTDRTPTVTGTCTDNTYRETNSNIQSIEVNIDGGGWSAVDALDGTYNSTSERFAYTTPELSYASHVIDVRCTDAASNVNTTDASEDLEFIIEAPSDDDEPIAEEYVEEFTSHDYQDFAGTTLIWGNGRLRLKEDISVSRTAVDTTGFADRYEEFGTARNYMIVEGVDANIAWYSKENQIWRLNRTDDTVTQFNPSDYGIGVGFVKVNDIDEFTYNDDRYLVVGSENGLFVFNLTDSTGYRDTSNGNINKVVPDLDRGRFGLYLAMIDADSGMKLAYWNLGTGADPFDGDTFTRIPTNTAGMSGTDVVRVYDSPVANEYYISVYGTGVFRWNDNNTPTNFADDQADIIASSDVSHDNFEYVFGATFDPNGKFIFGTSLSETGELFVVDSDGGTPYDTSDDTVYKLAEVADLGYNDVFDITYLDGANNVGDQLFVAMENGNPVYMNFNDTYSDSLDDTFIELVTNNGIRPSINQFIIDDYNTLYANIDRQGLYKIALDRGWESSGQAIALPPRPSKVLAINNFLADATTTDPISYIPGSGSNLAESGGVGGPGLGGLIPQAYAQSVNITYEVSLDDGVNWEEVTLGELQQVDLNDYRLQFRITMTPINGSSPVVNTYSVEYGGYPNPELLGQVAGFEVTISPSTIEENDSFKIDISAVDVIGFIVPGYSGTVTLQLQNLSNEDQTSLLSLNQMSLVNGEGTSTGTFVTKPGSYTIVASNAQGSGRSNVLTITPENDTDHISPTTPRLNFTADDYLICSGQNVSLRWVTQNMTSATLNGEPVGTDGTRQVSPTQTTEYVLAASGPNGSLTHRLTLTVDPDQSTCSQAGGPVTPNQNSGGNSTLSPDPDSELISSPEPSGSPGIGGTRSPSPAANITNPKLETPGDITAVAGETITIWWNAPDADFVTVDYLGGQTSTQGSFEFVVQDSQEILITAYKGDTKTERRVQINVVPLPLGLGSVLPPNVAGSLLRASKTFPALGLGLLIAGQTAVVALLLAGAAALTSVMWSGDTLVSALRAAGILPFKKRHGYVYQTKSLSPIPFAILSVRSADIKRTLLATLFTGVHGEYTEPHLGRGNYQIEAAHGTNSFPTVARRPAHLNFLDFYKGEPINVDSGRKSQAIIVPMDAAAEAQSKGAFSRVLALRLHQVLGWLQWTVWPLFFMSLVAIWLNPTPFNLLIAVIYVLLMASRLRAWLRRPLLSGVVTAQAGKPLNGVVVMLLTADGQLTALDRTNQAGRYAFFAKPGQYTLRVIAEGYSWVDESVGSTQTVNLTGSAAVRKNILMKPFMNAEPSTPFGS